MNQPLVSIIIPTKNSAAVIENCLASVVNQTYKKIEIIVIDNFSTDKTPEIAKKYTNNFYQKGPERSAQRNFGVEKAKGQFILIIDSDMVLTRSVIKRCVKKAKKGFGAIIIPEESFGEGFWAQCKKLERSFYVGDDSIEAARFFSRELFLELGGFDEELVSGEDWDLSNRARQQAKIGRIDELIFHNEGRINLIKTLRKKLYYASHFSKYLHKNNQGQQINLLYRYGLFFKQPKKLFMKPLVGCGMLLMKTFEFGFGGMGLMVEKLRKTNGV